MVRLVMRIGWKDVLSFSPARFCHGGGELVFFVVSHQCSRSFLRTYDDPGVSQNRGFIHFTLFLISFYFGFIKK